MLESRHEEAVEAAEEALEVARAAGDKVSELRALDATGRRRCSASPATTRARRALREALARARERG